MIIKKNRKGVLGGFSLVETIIYIFLVTVLTVVVVNSLIFMTKSYHDVKISKAFSLSANSILNRLSYEIKQADTVLSSGSVFNQPCVDGTNCLTLTNASSTIVFKVDNNLFKISLDNGTFISLTQPEVKIDSLIFNKLTTPNSQGLSTKLRLSYTSGGAAVTKDFEMVTMLRAINN